MDEQVKICPSCEEDVVAGQCVLCGWSEHA